MRADCARVCSPVGERWEGGWWEHHQDGRGATRLWLQGDSGGLGLGGGGRGAGRGGWGEAVPWCHSLSTTAKCRCKSVSLCLLRIARLDRRGYEMVGVGNSELKGASRVCTE